MRKHLIFAGMMFVTIGSFSIVQTVQGHAGGGHSISKQNPAPPNPAKNSGSTTPEFERRDREVTKEDLLILKRASEILSDATRWNRKDTRICNAEDTVWSLFCALQKASIEILGEYDHRRAALQEVRFVVEDETKGKKFEHRLRDYNNLPSTQFEDIKRVLKLAAERIASRVKTK